MNTQRSLQNRDARRLGWRARVMLALIVAAVGVVAGAGTASATIPIYTHPGLQQARFINTNPFVGTTTKPSDAEGLAYVPGAAGPQDDSIWLADDNAHRLYEIDATSGVLKRIVSRAELAAAVELGGTQVAGDNTASDFEAMAYDAAHDTLYVFAGKCCSTSIQAAAFRLLRDANGIFRVDSFQPFTSPLNDFSGVGEINGELWTALGRVLYKFDYETNTFSNSFTISGIAGSIDGISDSSGGDVWMVNSEDTLYRVNWTTRTLYPNHTFAMAPLGINDSRAVELVGDQLFICDGYDGYPSGSPNRYAIKVYDVVNLDSPSPPTASFTASPTSGPAPLVVQFTDTSTNGPTSWLWNFGDGTTSTAQNPSHTFTTAGSYQVTLTATNTQGSNTSTATTITVAGAQTVFTPTKDSFVNSGSPNKNYGTLNYLKMHSSNPENRAYVGFDVTGLGGPVAKAVLRLYVTDASNKGGDWYSVDPAAWTETGINWNNAPPNGALLASVGAVTANTWVDIDVTSAVTGNGSFSFEALTTSTNTLKYSSREGSNRPQLVLTVGDSSAPPVAAFTANPTSGQVPLQVTFTNTSTANATSWHWDFGDGTTSDVKDPPPHTFGTVGSYQVTLTAGNANGSSNATTTITVTAAPNNATFAMTKDSMVSIASPTKNYGTYDYIRALTDPTVAAEYRPYAAFDVTGLSGTITRAVIRLYVTDGSDKGGNWYSVDDPASWTETGLNWNNAPPLTGTPVASLGAVTAGTWIEVDVTSAVTGNGSFSFGAISPSTNSVRYASKEALDPATAPQIVVTTT
jgi:PKD repeat protein